MHSIKQDGSITGIHQIAHSSMANARQQSVGANEATDFARKEALSVSLKKNLETVNSVQKIVDQSR